MYCTVIEAVEVAITYSTCDLDILIASTLLSLPQSVLISLHRNELLETYVLKWIIPSIKHISTSGSTTCFEEDTLRLFS